MVKEQNMMVLGVSFLKENIEMIENGMEKEKTIQVEQNLKENLKMAKDGMDMEDVQVA